MLSHRLAGILKQGFQVLVFSLWDQLLIELVQHFLMRLNLLVDISAVKICPLHTFEAFCSLVRVVVDVVGDFGFLRMDLKLVSKGLQVLVVLLMLVDHHVGEFFRLIILTMILFQTGSCNLAIIRGFHDLNNLRIG